jgi:hypothetical protein
MKLLYLSFLAIFSCCQVVAGANHNATDAASIEMNDTSGTPGKTAFFSASTL